MTSLGRRMALLGALIVAAAGVYGWFGVDAVPEATVGVRTPSKFVPAVRPASTLPQDLAVLAQRQPWGAVKQEATQAGAAPAKNQEQSGNWRIGGILKLGEESFVILMIQPQPNTPHFIRYLGIGSTLPDGRTIEGITGDSVLLRQGEVKAVLRLYLPGAG